MRTTSSLGNGKEFLDHRGEGVAVLSTRPDKSRNTRAFLVLGVVPGRLDWAQPTEGPRYSE
jgi:hypothetical protein